MKKNLKASAQAQPLLRLLPNRVMCLCFKRGLTIISSMCCLFRHYEASNEVKLRTSSAAPERCVHKSQTWTVYLCGEGAESYKNNKIKWKRGHRQKLANGNFKDT